MAGTLFVVATPIGNLEDLTFRALRTLKEVDLIAAEDTRRTAKLLARYEVRKPLISVREQNEVREAPRLIARLSAGESIALVTDAGTPGIADPGAALVSAAHEAGIRVVPIPGACAVTAALSISGFATSEFVFMGFPPSSGSLRTDWFLRLASEKRVVVFFEAPHRIRRTIGDIAKFRSLENIALIREISKIHETFAISPITSVATEQLVEKGEYVAVLAPKTEDPSGEVDGAVADAMMGRLTELASFDQDTALEMAAHVLRSQASVVRKAIKKHRIAASRRDETSS